MRILSVSRDVDLLLRRNDALTSAGFSVISPKTPEDTPQLAAQRDVDAVLIGESVAPQERPGLISAIREVRPAVPVIFVYVSSKTRPEPLADISVDVTGGQTALINALTDYLGGGEPFPRA